MKLTLFLVFPAVGEILQSAWAITNEANPFWKLIIPPDSFGPPHSYGMLNYPHTGDKHTFCPYPGSSLQITFSSLQTDSSEISILGEVKSISEAGETIRTNRSLIDDLLQNGWVPGPPQKLDEYRKILHLPPVVSAR